MKNLILKRFTRSKDRSIVAMESNSEIEIRQDIFTPIAVCLMRKHETNLGLVTENQTKNWKKAFSYFFSDLFI